MRRKCGCGEPIAKVAREPGGIVPLGSVVVYVTGRVTVECRKCHRIHDLHDLLAQPQAVILPRPRLDK